MPGMQCRRSTQRLRGAQRPRLPGLSRPSGPLKEREQRNASYLPIPRRIAVGY
jgi:hypothetical protein